MEVDERATEAATNREFIGSGYCGARIRTSSLPSRLGANKNATGAIHVLKWLSSALIDRCRRIASIDRVISLTLWKKRF